MGYEERMIFCSFNHLSIQTIHLAAPEMKIGYLYLRAYPGILPLLKKLGVEAVHITQQNLQEPGILDKCRELGIKINAWTINKEKDYRICESRGINAVITDYPDRIRQFRDVLRKETNQKNKSVKRGSYGKDYYSCF